ncbi:MAG: Nascent polypeptide-associated complex protein [Candidatus Proteinoplasmatales archaeon SG8-5]|nr:MAG: Nascent polypeptide-associated complex protein [Candidatus Proteinoplasmatales archaeon SG8-5]
MMPGMRGMNPRQMKQAMKRMGIETEEMENVEEVVIKADGKVIVIRDAAVTITTMQGQKSYQVVGETEVLEGDEAQAAATAAPGAPPSIKIPEEDIELVMAQANASYEDAKAALIEAKGEPAEAIIKLMSK